MPKGDGKGLTEGFPKIDNSIYDNIEVFPAYLHENTLEIVFPDELKKTLEDYGFDLQPWVSEGNKPLFIPFPVSNEQAIRIMLSDSGKAVGKGGKHSNGIYEKADYHGKTNNSVKNKAPNMGQEALDNSVPIGSNTTRRVGISDGEIVVFDETSEGIFHGHVRSWDELNNSMKAALRKACMVNKKGEIQ